MTVSDYDLVTALGRLEDNLVPFALAFQLQLRRGPALTASLFALAGRVLVLLSFVAGMLLGLVSPVVMMMIPGLAVIALLSELLAASVYATSRNLAVIALVDATWLAYMLSSSLPIRL